MTNMNMIFILSETVYKAGLVGHGMGSKQVGQVF